MKYIGKNNEYLETATIDLSDKHLIEQSKSGDLILLWFESDENSFTIDNVDYTFHTNDIVCFTEFHVVRVKQLKKARIIKWNKYFYCVINHDSEVGCKGILFYGAMVLPIIRVGREETKSLDLVWSLISQEMSSNDSLQAEMLQMSLKRLLILCTRIYKSQSHFKTLDPSQIDLIRAYYFLVEQHFKEKHTVAEYATLMFKSPKTLANAFKKWGGKSPLQYIKDRKMLEARRLLSHSNLSISEIGDELGFSDIQSFSRFFKREEGISPAKFKAHSV